MSDSLHVLPEWISSDRFAAVYLQPRQLLICGVQYEKLLATDASTSASASSTTVSDILAKIRNYPTISPDIESLPRVRQAQDVIKLYTMANTKTEKKHVQMARCPVNHGGNMEDLERDFTTLGVQGMLGCPFAKMSNGLGGSTQNDPIAAEFHQDSASGLSPPVDQRPGQCPIRFLDQHSPEEVAQYFENHKHEIPRSHEICVRRYGGNESSARQLDAKYGNLVNMIQGLGVKHKAYLPERDRNEELDKGSNPSVEKWAQTVESEPPNIEHEDIAIPEEPRMSRFEKPLREVRVGESPSRPWGISVPADKEPTPSALQGDEGLAHLNNQSSSSPQGPDTNPRAHSTSYGKTIPEPKRNTRESDDSKDNLTHIVFNGPVFFGYSADEVAALLKNTNLGGLNTGV
jgi:hypothetical protein